MLQKFQNYLDKMENYRHAIALMNWDLSAKCPPKGKEDRIRTISYFSQELFALRTSDEYGACLQALAEPETFDTLSMPMQVTVTRYLDKYRQFKQIPAEFNKELVETRARSEQEWARARKENDFSIFAPWLEKNVDYTRRFALYLKPDQDPFATLVGQRLEGMKVEEIDKLFRELKEGLLPLLDCIMAAPKPDLTVVKEAKVTENEERDAQDVLLHYVGFDFTRGTVGEMPHPLTSTIGHNDVRVTNHFRANQPLDVCFSAIHESGHGIYDQQVDPQYIGSALAELDGADLHESQSRFYENILGRNINFWKPIYPALQEVMPALKEIPLETWERAANEIAYSPIRTEADELTYCLHIILRYEMERAIFAENLSAEEIRSMWNQKSLEYLHITPADDAHGVLQDLHWSSIFWGYFQNYLLGSIYDGMYLKALTRDLGDVNVILAEGRIADITAWLREKIHRYGSLYNGKETAERVYGEKVTVQPFLEYAWEKYSRLYGFDNLYASKICDK